MQNKLQHGWLTTQICFIATILLTYPMTILQPPSADAAAYAGILVATGKNLGLLIFAPAILQRKEYALPWLCYMLLLYFVSAVWNVQDGLELGHIILTLSIIDAFTICALFTAAMMSYRWQKESNHADTA